MQYLTRESSVGAINNITSLQNDLRSLYAKYGIDLGHDVGRQNILLSAAQEHFFARAIASVVGECTNDGRTGAADILIDSLDNREVECKVLSKSKTGAWQFQADKASLVRKGSSDFLYLMFNREYTEVGVFLFESLTPEDFKDPSPGSRGKSRLNKVSAFKKCTPIIGSFSDKRLKYMRKYEEDLKCAVTPRQKEIAAQKLECGIINQLAIASNWRRLMPLENKDFNVGTVVYFISKKSEQVIPALISEKIVRTSTSTSRVTYILEVRSKAGEKLIEVDPTATDIFADPQAVRDFMLERAKAAIDNLIASAVTASKIFPGLTDRIGPGAEFPTAENESVEVILEDGKVAKLRM